MKLKIKLIYVILLLLVMKASAQHDFKKTDEWLNAHTAEMGGRSILLIYKDGQLVHNYSVNNMNFKQKTLVRLMSRKQGKTADLTDYTASSRQMIASCSKWLSAALVMTFVEEGKLRLTDTVGKYLPVLSKHGKGNITVSQCLSHLTGIKAPPLKESIHEITNADAMDDAIAAIAAAPMEGTPGKVFNYSNTGLQIAGAVLEKISGKSFEMLFAERIAIPLQMKNTDFGKGKVALPAGGATSTAEDYMNFLIMILNGGTFNGKQILTPESIKEMQENRITNNVRIAHSPGAAAKVRYGFGEWILNDKDGSRQYISSPGLFGSFPWVDHKRQYAGFLMTFYLNNDGRQQRYGDLKKLIDEAIK